jgi:hypothetical protein
MKYVLAVFLFGSLCVSTLATSVHRIKELPGKGTYDHVGVIGSGATHPDYSVSVGELTVGCYGHSDGVDCSSEGGGVMGYFMLTFEDGSKHTLGHTLIGNIALQNLELSGPKNDRHFRYRLLPDEDYGHFLGYGREVGIKVHILCTPGRDKHGNETKAEACFSYE